MIGASIIHRIDVNTVKVECFFCHAQSTIPFTEKQQRDWDAGVHIQNVIPDVSEDIRELLISGQCGACFDAAFGDEDDD
jgi:hypothetical protein